MVYQILVYHGSWGSSSATATKTCSLQFSPTADPPVSRQSLRTKKGEAARGKEGTAVSWWK